MYRCTSRIPPTDRLPHRGDDRNAVPAGRRAPHRRDLRLHGAAGARAQGEAARLGVHQREDRPHPGVATRSRPWILRPAGGHRRAARARRTGRAPVQPAQRRGDPPHDPHVGRHDRLRDANGASWWRDWRTASRRARKRAQALPRRPRVYFEEWDEPLISGIRWVSELIGIAGGDDCFPELSVQSLGRQRIIADAAEVPRRAPDIIFGSWCGKKFRPEEVAARPGWSAIPAVRSGFVREIKSADHPAARTRRTYRRPPRRAGGHRGMGRESTKSPDARE